MKCPDGAAVVDRHAVVRRGCPRCSGTLSTTRREVDGWKLATCDRCAFLYAPIIRADTSSEFEAETESVPTARRRHAQVHRLLERHLPDGALVVDIGAGFGGFAELVRDGGRLDYLGFEPSASIAAQARARGVNVVAEPFAPGVIDRRADAVVLDNVIEHVAEPFELLAAAAGELAPGGLLVVIVPNRHDLRQVHRGWRDANHWIPPEHINYFSPGDMRHALRDLGLDVRSFGLRALDGARDARYWPRAALEAVGLQPFGINVVGVAP